MCKMSSGLRIIVNKGQDPLCKLVIWPSYFAFQGSQSTDTETCHVYLKYREANVEYLAHVSFSLVRFLHDRHIDVFII